MELTDALKTMLEETARTLRGSERRRFLAQTVEALGPGGQRRAQQEFAWGRDTIRKGQREREQGLTCLDAFNWFEFTSDLNAAYNIRPEGLRLLLAGGTSES